MKQCKEAHFSDVQHLVEEVKREQATRIYRDLIEMADYGEIEPLRYYVTKYFDKYNPIL